jgi:hypothetical protein
MGASAQQILQSDPEYLRRQLAAQEQQRVNPTGSAAGALGALLGRGLSNVSQGKGFFQAPDFGLQRVAGVQGIMRSVQFDPNNPAEYYNQVGRALQEAGYADLAPMAFTEARKLQVQERTLSTQEEDVKLRRQAAERKVSSEQTTTKGIRVFRRGDGPLQVEEDGKDVPYDPEKHGRFETASDRISNKGVQIRDIPGPGGIGVIGREVYDSNTGATIRREYFGQQPGTAPAATTPAATGATWNYVPGKGMVKAP